MEKYLYHTIMFFSLSLICSCVHLTRSETETLKELKSYGVKTEDAEKIANPVLAGALNILPGIGNFYLGSGNGADTPQYLYGVGNIICYPFSIAWAVPQAFIDANTINQREMVYYYNFDKKGKLKLEELRKTNK